MLEKPPFDPMKYLAYVILPIIGGLYVAMSNGFGLARSVATKDDLKTTFEASLKSTDEKFSQMHQEILQVAQNAHQEVTAAKEQVERYSDGNRKGVTDDFTARISVMMEKVEANHTEQRAFEAQQSTAMVALVKSVDNLADTFKFWLRDQPVRRPKN